MNLATVAAFLLLLQTPPKGAIEGIVVRADNGNPVIGVQVTLDKIQTTPIAESVGIPIVDSSGRVVAVVPPPPFQVAPVTTGSGGTFSFKDLDPGIYRVYAIANGYARQEYDQRTSTSIGTTVDLTEGQTLKDLSI